MWTCCTSGSFEVPRRRNKRKKPPTFCPRKVLRRNASSWRNKSYGRRPENSLLWISNSLFSSLYSLFSEETIENLLFSNATFFFNSFMNRPTKFVRSHYSSNTFGSGWFFTQPLTKVIFFIYVLSFQKNLIERFSSRKIFH